MPPTSPAASGPDAEGGFALLETVLALAILAFAAAICLPRAGAEGGLPLALLRTAGAAGALLREDRNAALASGRAVASEIDAANRSLRSGTTGRQLLVADALRMETRLGTEASRRGLITFLPDGRSTGARIDIGYGTLRYRIAVDPLTSAVTVVRVPGKAAAERAPS